MTAQELLTRTGKDHHLVISQNMSEPIELIFDDPETHLTIVAKEGVMAEIVEHLHGGKHSVTLELRDHSHIDFVSLQNAEKGTDVEIQQNSRMGAHAKLHVHNVTLGGKTVRHDFTSALNGEKSESSVDWIFYAKNAERQMLSARNIFNAPNGGGEIIMQGVAEDKAHTQCNGMIEITRNGGGTNTYLTEAALMLDATAKVDAVPGLEIKTNDVKASHSATVTKVGKEDLFYFASRGIQEKEARRMYIEGFLSALTEKFSQENVRTCVQEAIAKKYEESF